MPIPPPSAHPPWRAARSRPWRGALALLALLLAGSARAQAPGGVEGGLTLADAVSRALAGGADARAARLEVGRADDALARTRGAYLPQLGVSAQGGWTNRLDESFTAVSPGGAVRELGLATLGDDPWLDVFVEQRLIDLEQIGRQRREGLSAEMARAAEAVQSEAIAYDVTQRYVQALRLEALGAAARARVADAEQLDERSRTLLDAGRAMASERERAALHLEESRLRARSLGGELADARGALWRAIGGGGERAAGPALAPASLPDPAPPDGEISDADLRAAPALRLLELQRRAGEASVFEARAGRYPVLQLRGGYAHYGIRRFDNFSDEAYVFVGMEMPLFDGFQTRRAVARAHKTAELARLRAASALDELRARARELSRRLEDARARAQLSERRAAAAREAQRLADLRLGAGRGRLEEAVATRERRAGEDERAVDARFAGALLWAELQRELGRLADAVAPGAAPAPAPAP